MYILYSKDNCPRCVTAKQLLERKGVEYEVMNAEGDEHMLAWLRRQGVRQMPFITKTDDSVVGGLEELVKELF